MTLIRKLDLDMVKMYRCTENEFPYLSGSKVITSKGGINIYLHTWIVKMMEHIFSVQLTPINILTFC